MPAISNPSRIVGTIVMTAILIVGLMEAARQVGGDSVAILLFQITELGGKVIFGTVIIVVGIFLARILSTLVGSSTGEVELCPNHRQICDHRLVHRDRPDLHGPCRPDRDDGVRPDPRLGGGGDGHCFRPRRPRRGGSGARTLDRRADAADPPPRSATAAQADGGRGRPAAAAWCDEPPLPPAGGD